MSLWDSTSSVKCGCPIVHHLHKRLKERWIKEIVMSFLEYIHFFIEGIRALVTNYKDSTFCIYKLNYPVIKQRIFFCKKGSSFWKCLDPGLEKSSRITIIQ